LDQPFIREPEKSVEELIRETDRALGREHHSEKIWPRFERGESPADEG